MGQYRDDNHWDNFKGNIISMISVKFVGKWLLKSSHGISFNHLMVYPFMVFCKNSLPKEFDSGNLSVFLSREPVTWHSSSRLVWYYIRTIEIMIFRANIEFDFTIFGFLNGEYLSSEIIKTCIPVKCIYWVINLIFVHEISCI